MDPTEVTPSNFKLDEVVYNLNGFSVVWGIWEDGSRRLAMRWNGEGKDKGFPKSSSHPVWLVLPSEFSLPILQALGAYRPSHRGIQES